MQSKLEILEYYLEIWYPFLLSIIAAITFGFFYPKFTQPSLFLDKLFSNTVTISTAIIGFFMAIMTIMHSIDTRRMRFIRQGNLYPRILGYVKKAIMAHFVIITLSFFQPIEGQFKCVSVDCQLKVFRYLHSAELFFILLPWFLGLRFTHIFLMLFADISSDDTIE